MLLQGNVNEGYEIVGSVATSFSGASGVALGRLRRELDGIDQYVTWQYSVCATRCTARAESGCEEKPRYDWGHYFCGNNPEKNRLNAVLDMFKRVGQALDLDLAQHAEQKGEIK